MASIWLKLAAGAAVAAMTAGCSSMGIRDHRGYILDKELATNIQVGIDNKDSVTKTLGRPSFVGQFNADDWYYLARDTRSIPFRDPRVSRTCSRPSIRGNVASVGQTARNVVAVNPS